MKIQESFLPSFSFIFFSTGSDCRFREFHPSSVILGVFVIFIIFILIFCESLACICCFVVCLIYLLFCCLSYLCVVLLFVLFICCFVVCLIYLLFCCLSYLFVVLLFVLFICCFVVCLLQTEMQSRSMKVKFDLEGRLAVIR